MQEKKEKKKKRLKTKRNGLDVVSFLKHFNYSFHILLYAMCFYMRRKFHFIQHENEKKH